MSHGRIQFFARLIDCCLTSWTMFTTRIILQHYIATGVVWGPTIILLNVPLMITSYKLFFISGPSWSKSFDSWIINYICNQCPSPLTLWGRIPLMANVLDATLCYKVCLWLAAGRWFYPGTPDTPINKTNRKDITGIFLKVDNITTP